MLGRVCLAGMRGMGTHQACRFIGQPTMPRWAAPVCSCPRREAAAASGGRHAADCAWLGGHAAWHLQPLGAAAAGAGEPLPAPPWLGLSRYRALCLT